MRQRLRERRPGAFGADGLDAAAQITALQERVQVLEDEVQECRQLNLRLAELTDVVGELLLPVAQRDEAKVAEVMEKYARGI